MLQKLFIKNLAIIEDIELVFHAKQTALTGETGAGKSLVIDSLKLIFGARADTDLIRYKEDEAMVKAYFLINGTPLIIERWISRKDRNRVFINEKPHTLNDLKTLGKSIGDIHEQHDTLKLLEPDTSLTMLDQLGEYESLQNEYTILRHQYLEADSKYHQALKKTHKVKEEHDVFQFQLDELVKANLSLDETSVLEKQISTLSNQKVIVDRVKESYEIVSTLDDENVIYNAYKSLENIEKHDDVFKRLKERLETIHYEIGDIKEQLYDHLDALRDLSILELDDLQERFYFIKDLEKKYGKSNNHLIEYIQELEEEILKIENYDGYVETLKTKKENAYKEAFSKGIELSKKRKHTAKKLETEFVSILKNLSVNYVDFEVTFLENKEKELYETGIDQILFKISLNEGEPLMPFYKVASGGELSRSMLALKILFAKTQKLNLVVFDEIDLGISGEAALKVATELHQLSKDIQVVSITHLPQVAAKACMHYHISKYTKDARTYASVSLLKEEERVYKIAHMLSGDMITEGAILHAKSLLK